MVTNGFNSTTPARCTVVKARSRESSPSPTSKPGPKTSWWPRTWLVVVSTSRTCPWSLTTTWPRTSKVTDPLSDCIPAIVIQSTLPVRPPPHPQCLPSALSSPTCRLHPSYRSYGSCRQEWRGDDLPHQGGFGRVLRPEASHPGEPGLHLSTRVNQPPRRPAQAWDHPDQEEARRDHLRVIHHK